MRFRLTLGLPVLLVCCCGIVTGQILGPELERGKFEAGYIAKWFSRKMGFTEFDWTQSSIFTKYGVTGWLTVSTEALIWNIGSTERFPHRDYRAYVIGVGVVTRFWDIEGYRIALGLHWNEDFSFDRSDSRYHKNTRSFVGAIQAERTFSPYGQRVILWLAPAWVYDETAEWPWGQSFKVTDKSSNNFGAVAGVNLLFFRHVAPFFHVVYADFFQPRVGIGYEF